MPDHEPTTSLLREAHDARLEGDHKQAVALLSEALDREPNNVSALALRAGLASDLGDGAAAQQFLSRALALQPRNIDLMIQLGDIRLANHQPKEALQQYQQALTSDANRIAAWNGLGACHRMLGQSSDAWSAYAKAHALDPDNPVAPSALGMLAAADRQLDQARRYFEAAAAAAPQLPQSHFNLANVLSELDELEASASCYRQALALAPNYVDAWVNLALIQETQGEFDLAIQSLDQALAIFPEHKRAWYLKANLLEQQSSLEAADVALARGFALDAANPHFHLVKARLERRTGNSDAALRRLQQLDPGAIPETLLGPIRTEEGRLCDALGESAGAFAAYSEANSIAEQRWRADNPGGNEFEGRLTAIQGWLSGGALDRWPAPLADQGRTPPVFLIGFPRSGTTLLDRILRSHGDFCVMEENSALGHLTRVIDDRFGGYPEGTSKLSEPVCAQLRDNYLRNAMRLGSPEPGQVLVDKLPLNTIHVGLIHRLFPSAKLVFALRHPLDVVLSCFMQAFEPNAAMANFFSLDQAAAVYARVLDIWLAYEKALPVQVHYIKYEDVVTDFETTIRALTTYLERPYRPEMSRYYEVRGASIKTPSYHQVSRPIYADSRYRWRRYVPYLGPSTRRLEPYLQRFGYEVP